MRANFGGMLNDNFIVRGFQNIGFAVADGLSRFLFAIWSGLAGVVNVLEDVFMMLAGRTRVYQPPPLPDGSVPDTYREGTDLVSDILGAGPVQQTFYSLMAVATVLLIFFTIIVLIRNQYKEKDGGNPYQVVFRMFKGMVMFLFITTAVMVGIQVSGVILDAMDRATSRGTNSYMTANIFAAMAYNSNRVRMDLSTTNSTAFPYQNQRRRTALTSNEGAGLGRHDDIYSLFSRGDRVEEIGGGFRPVIDFNVRDERRGMLSRVTTRYRITATHGFANYSLNYQYYTEVWGVVGTITVGETTVNIYGWNASLGRQNQSGTRTVNETIGVINRIQVGDGEAGAPTRFFGTGDSEHMQTFSSPVLMDAGSITLKYSPHEVVADSPELAHERYLDMIDNMIATDGSQMSANARPIVRFANHFNNVSNFTDENARIAAIGDWIENNRHIGYDYFTDPADRHDLTWDDMGFRNYSIVEGSNPLERRIYTGAMITGSRNVQRLTFYVLHLDQHARHPNRSGTTVVEWLQSRNGEGNRNIESERHLSVHSGGLNLGSLWNVGGGTNESVANFIDAHVVERFYQFNLYLHRNTEDMDYFDQHNQMVSFIGPVHYTNSVVVSHLYHIPSMNIFIIGFGGMLIIFGVFINFAFALVQRLVEMAVLYMMSPITIAFYPFDDGNAFNGMFIKPFYQKLIAVFAIVLSLNLFFILFPVMHGITFFYPGGVGAFARNQIASMIVMLAMLAMLPAIRTRIQQMLGADSLEEKKFGDVLKQSYASTFGNTGADQALKKAGKKGLDYSTQVRGHMRHGKGIFSAMGHASFGASSKFGKFRRSIGDEGVEEARKKIEAEELKDKAMKRESKTERMKLAGRNVNTNLQHKIARDGYAEANKKIEKEVERILKEEQGPEREEKLAALKKELDSNERKRVSADKEYKGGTDNLKKTLFPQFSKEGQEKKYEELENYYRNMDERAEQNAMRSDRAYDLKEEDENGRERWMDDDKLNAEQKARKASILNDAEKNEWEGLEKEMDRLGVAKGRDLYMQDVEDKYKERKEGIWTDSMVKELARGLKSALADVGSDAVQALYSDKAFQQMLKDSDQDVREIAKAFEKYTQAHKDGKEELIKKMQEDHGFEKEGRLANLLKTSTGQVEMERLTSVLKSFSGSKDGEKGGESMASAFRAMRPVIEMQMADVVVGKLQGAATQASNDEGVYIKQERDIRNEGQTYAAGASGIDEVTEIFRKFEESGAKFTEVQDENFFKGVIQQLNVAAANVAATDSVRAESIRRIAQRMGLHGTAVQLKGEYSDMADSIRQIESEIKRRLARFEEIMGQGKFPT